MPTNTNTAQPELPRIVPCDLTFAINDLSRLVKDIGQSSHPTAQIIRRAYAELHLAREVFAGVPGADERAASYVNYFLQPSKKHPAKEAPLTPRKAERFRQELAAHGLDVGPGESAG